MKEKNIYIIISTILFLILGNHFYGFAMFVWLSRANNSSINIVAYLNYIPAFIGLLGIIMFVATSFKNTNLLRLYMCLVIAFLPFTIWYYYKLFNGISEYDSYKPPINYLTYIYLGVTIILLATCSFGLLYFQKKRIPLYTYHTIDDETIAEFSPAPAPLRFVNRLIDIMVIFYIIYKFAENNNRNTELFYNNAALLLVEIIVWLFYYLVLEVIFKTTAGKCITDTIIINDSGKTASIGQLFGRTFCRMIPFDAFSFLSKSKRGWHDTISGTYVVQSANKEEGKM